MSGKSKRIPKYCLHRPTGLARVIIDGHHVYLGVHGSDASREEYGRLIAERFGQDKMPANAVPQTPATVITVSELILKYWQERVQPLYQKDGKPTDRQSHMRLAIAPLRRLYGKTLGVDFGPRKLKAVREEIIADGYQRRGGLNRKYVNDHIRIIKRMFRWCVGEELLPREQGASICSALDSVENLRKNEDHRVTESTKVKSAPEADVTRTLPFMSPQIRTMIRLLQLTGMRPDEVTIMRPMDILQRKDIWLYRPESHKLEHKDIERVVPLGPSAQELLAPWLNREQTAYLFSPREVVEANHDRTRKNKKTKVKKNNRRQPRDHYDDESLCQAVTRACVKASVPKWTPGQLRHSVATRVKTQFDRETARQLLGHGSASTTDIYVDEMFADAIEAMKVIG